MAKLIMFECGLYVVILCDYLFIGCHRYSEHGALA